MFDEMELHEIKLQEIRNNPDLSLCVECENNAITLREHNLNDGYCKPCFEELFDNVKYRE